MRQAFRLSAVFCLVSASALWGAATVLNKALLGTVPPLALLALQLLASSVLLWIIVFARRMSMPSWQNLLPLILLGILNPGISYSLGLLGLSRVSASLTTLLWAAEPILIALIAVFVVGEAVSKRLAGIMALGLAGVMLVTNVLPGFEAASTDLAGPALLLAAVVCCAFYSAYSRKLTHAADPVTIVAIQQAAGLALALLLLLAPTPWGSLEDFSTIPGMTIAASGLSGLMYYAIAYVLFLSALRHVPAGVAGGYFNLIPVFGIILAFVFLDERLEPQQWLGAAIILVSAILLMRLTSQIEAKVETVSNGARSEHG